MGGKEKFPLIFFPGKFLWKFSKDYEYFFFFTKKKSLLLSCWWFFIVLTIIIIIILELSIKMSTDNEWMKFWKNKIQNFKIQIFFKNNQPTNNNNSKSYWLTFDWLVLFSAFSVFCSRWDFQWIHQPKNPNWLFSFDFWVFFNFKI